MRSLLIGALLATAGVAVANGSALVLQDAKGALTVTAIAPDLVRIAYEPNGMTGRPTEMLDPKGLRSAKPVGKVNGGVLETASIRVGSTDDAIVVTSLDNGTTVRIDRAGLADGVLRLRHGALENLYGMRGYPIGSQTNDPRLARSNGLTRNLGAPVSASAQGDGGAPLAYSTHWGLLVDSVDGDFSNSGDALTFSHGSRKDVEAYVVLGPPERTIEMATELTGPVPMPPKWAMGFMNSQWKTDENEIKSIISTYRQKQIPIDSFIMDFDFKAWGEDDFGEFRWNSTNNPGNFEPNKFPDGQSGLFGKQMADQGIHLVGIMKPRVLVENVDHKPTKQAIEANAKGWWLHKKPYTDYFSHRLANDFDFSKPEVRKFYWDHAKNLFDTGISGWWNDEADDNFDSLGFFHMQESLYEGQRSVSNRRVWSLNRNFYLGAQRFAFGTWSGDIGTGFDWMRDQSPRMLALIDLGQAMWSMDTGGFGGHPSPENYARWMEFASVVPIMRVHNTYGEHRQPWVYGPVAEAAAKKAIELRYAMFPSLYSWQHEALRTGVGIVRPLFWEFPDDNSVANITDEWMLGDQLLAAPVMVEGQRAKEVTLPAGKWYSYPGDQPSEGGKVTIPVDADKWSDLPLFVRAGSIFATQPVLQFAAEKPIEEITLHVWPDPAHEGRFTVYDDDGETYAYERGASFSQEVTATQSGSTVTIGFAKPKGSYRTSIRRYRIDLHPGASSAKWNGKTVDTSDIVVPAGQAGALKIEEGSQRSVRQKVSD
ncbi:MAG TPA: TIM-barrel domain-containing protein [Fimbriimonadaceae bacterium]|nr:TIM-barrel domain-containing protein [Fimbriimonadaceae bacterium]